MRPGQEGFLLGQPSSYGLTQQSTIVPGVTQGVAVPAAGAGFTFTCQPYDRWRLVAVAFQLTTSSTSANRYVSVDYLDGQAVAIASDGTDAATVASTTGRQFSGALNYGSESGATGTTVRFPLSGLWLEPGQRVQINVLNIDTTDQIDKIRLTFDRWPENPIDYGDENSIAQELNERAEQFAVALKRMTAALELGVLSRDLANN